MNTIGTISVPFSFPNEQLDPESLNQRAYNCLARSHILDSDSLIDNFSLIVTDGIHGLGAGTKRVIYNYLVSKQIEYIADKKRISEEAAEELFLYNIARTNDPGF